RHPGRSRRPRKLQRTLSCRHHSLDDTGDPHDPPGHRTPTDVRPATTIAVALLLLLILAAGVIQFVALT
ncbi:MAG: hypothetical protein M3507_06145, partial [Actinomycetota bacterium]|nr:hypothetical protein [Actinomycetota bacterium]